MFPLSSHGAGGCGWRRCAHAGGDFRPHSAHPYYWIFGERHRINQPQRETTGPLCFLWRVLCKKTTLHLPHHTCKSIVLYLTSRCASRLKVVNTVLQNTSSGGFCSNDGIIHMTLPSLPFGGVGRFVFWRYGCTSLSAFVSKVILPANI